MKYRVYAFAAVLVASLPGPPLLADDDGVRGPPFVEAEPDPGLRPPGWAGQPVVHGEDVGDVALAIALDQQQYSVLLPLIEDFAHAEGVKIAVSDGTCGISTGLLAKRAIDIGGLCCPPGAADRFEGLRFHTLAIAAIALVVHRDNPMTNVSLTEARRLFRGTVKNWSELEPIAPSTGVVPMGRLHCKLRPGHWRLLLADENQFSPWLIEVGSIQDVISNVALNPQAVGLEALAMVARFKNLGEVKALNLAGVSPADLDALAEGRYPIYRTYNLTTWEGAAANPLADKLVAHLMAVLDEKAAEFHMVPASRLRAHGWRFKGDELIGEPQP